MKMNGNLVMRFDQKITVQQRHAQFAQYSRWQQRVSLLLITLACLLASAVYANPAQAQVSAEVDYNEVQLGNAVNLLIRASGNNRISGQPNFSALETDFDLGPLSQGTQFQMSNAGTQTIQTWTLPLYPKRAGSITIPSIPVGQFFTQPITLKVTQGKVSPQQNNLVQLKASVSAEETWLGAPIIYTNTIYTRAELNNAQLTQPNVTNATVTSYGKDRSYETTLNGRRWSVIERRYLVTPKSTGTITIPSTTLTGSTGNMFRRGKSFRLNTEPLTFTVQPKPTNYPANAIWLPLDNLSLSESWSPKPLEFRVGEPVSRTISIRTEASSNLRLSNFSLPDAQGFNIYPGESASQEQNTTRGMTTLSEYSFSIIPTQTGTFTLPEITVPWFNVQTKQVEYAKLPAKTVQVKAGISGINSIASTTDTNANSDDNNAESATGEQNPLASQQPRDPWLGLPYWPYWPYVAALLGLVWLITLLLWWLTNKRRNNAKTALRGNTNQLPNHDLAAAKTALQQACKNYDASSNQAKAASGELDSTSTINEARQAIIAYAQAVNANSVNAKSSTTNSKKAIHNITNLDAVAALDPNNTALHTALQQLQANAYGTANSAQNSGQNSKQYSTLTGKTLLTTVLQADLTAANQAHPASQEKLAPLNPL